MYHMCGPSLHIFKGYVLVIAFLQGQIYVPMHLYGEKVEKSFSKNVLKTNV